MKIEDTIDSIYKLKNVFNGIAMNDAKDIAVLAYSGLWDMEVSDAGKCKCHEIIVELIAQNNCIEIEDKWTLYYEIVRASFTYPFMADRRAGLRKAYISIYTSIMEKLLKTDIKITRITGSTDRQIVLVTDQFLGISHSPTKQILDYAYAIQHNLGYKVLIINSGTCWLNEDTFIPLNSRKNYCDEYRDINVVEYLGESFNFYQCESNAANIDVLAGMFCGIRVINPYCVIGIGDSNILVDICRHFTKTAVIPCDISVPITMAEYPLIPMKLNQCEEDLEEVIMSWQKPIETVFNFVTSEEKDINYSRGDYKIPEGAFVITVVGNRLNDECTEEFWMTCDTILKSIDNAYIVIIGAVEDAPGILSRRECGERFCMIDWIDSLKGFMKIADLLIQPTRKGGGRSTVNALEMGVPVVITQYGDSYYNAGTEFAVGSYEDMIESVCKYATDRAFYEKMSKMAKHRAEELADINGTVKAWIDELLA